MQLPIEFPESEQVSRELVEQNQIVTELSDEAKLKIEVIQSLLEPCDRATYGNRLRDAATRLGKSVRTVQRMVKSWQEEGIAGLSNGERTDKGAP